MGQDRPSEWLPGPVEEPTKWVGSFDHRNSKSVNGTSICIQQHGSSDCRIWFTDIKWHWHQQELVEGCWRELFTAFTTEISDWSPLNQVDFPPSANPVNIMFIRFLVNFEYWKTSPGECLFTDDFLTSHCYVCDGHVTSAEACINWHDKPATRPTWSAVATLVLSATWIYNRDRFEKDNKKTTYVLDNWIFLR